MAVATHWLPDQVDGSHDRGLLTSNHVKVDLGHEVRGYAGAAALRVPNGSSHCAHEAIAKSQDVNSVQHDGPLTPQGILAILSALYRSPAT